MKSKDGITIYLETERSGTTYIKLRATIEIDGIKKNKRISTGLIYSPENLAKVKDEARPIFYEKLGLQLHQSVMMDDFYLEAFEYINLNVIEETKKDRISKFERFVLPFFTNQDISKTGAGAVERWQFELLQKGVSADLVRRSKWILKKLFERAILLGYRKDNPVDSTSTVRYSHNQQHTIYSKDEIVLMVAHADGWLKVFILLIATLWLRSGEVVVLKWDDVDFPKKELTIQRAIRRGEFRKPKTGVRTIDIPDTMMNILEEYKKESKSKWLFPNPRGGENYSDAKFINQNYFQPLLKRLEIPYIGMYELKHTGISLTFAGGVEPDFIANHAGHTDKSTFLKYYAQFIKNEESIKKLDKVLDFNT